MAANVPAPLKPIDIECVIYADTSKPDGTPRKLLDASKLSALCWRPRITLEASIRQTYAWYRTSRRR
jgi:GDP-L-fucose synthase